MNFDRSSTPLTARQQGNETIEVITIEINKSNNRKRENYKLNVKVNIVAAQIFSQILGSNFCIFIHFFGIEISESREHANLILS